MRGMYKSRTLVGISLKKISGKEAKWEEYNIEKLSLDEIDEYIAVLQEVAREARADAPFVASGPYRSAQSRSDDVDQNNPDTWAMTWHARKRKPIAVDD